MPLTDVELHILEVTAAATRRHDPRLARRLSRGSYLPRTVDVVTVGVGALFLAMSIIGVTLRLPVVCATGWTLAFVSMVVRGMYADREY